MIVMALFGGLVAMFLLGGFLLWFVWVGFFWVLDRAVDAVPPAWEAEFGKVMAESQERPVCQDPVVTQAVGTITQRLTRALPANQPYPFRFQVVWDPQENAFAMPGGQVLVTTGLIAGSKSPDEVAGVLGHEIQHVLSRHSFRGIARDLGLSLVLAVALGDQGGLYSLAKGGQHLLDLGFSREQELEADRGGIAIADRAGYDADAIGEFFRRQQQEAQLDPTTERALAFLSTHPANAERLKQLDKLADALTDRDPSAAAVAAWSDVKRRAAAMPAELEQAPAEE